MSYKDTYNDWLQNPYFDEATKEELRAIADDEKRSKTAFTVSWNLVRADSVVSLEQEQTV